jgi:hypothetical protein
MSLRVMQPIQINEANITSTNVALETAWTAGTYNLGDQRRVDERNYEVSSATTTQTPSATATEWFDIGPANRYAAFDLQFGADKYRVIETKTTNADTITYTLESLTRITSMGFFGLSAASISIVGTVATTGDVANINYTLKDSTDYSGSMFRWLFVPQSLERKYINFNLNIPAGATVVVTITNTGGVAKVGSLTMGIYDSYGTMGTDAARANRSRSIKETSGTLTSLLRRTASAKVSYPVTLQDYQSDPFWRLVEDMEGVGGVFAAPDDNPELTVYGFITSAQTTAKVHGLTRLKLEVESL